MHKLIVGILFMSLAMATTAEPVEPAPTSAPEPVVTTTTDTNPTSTVEENKPKLKEEPKVLARPEADKEKPIKKKRPLEIKWIDF